MIRAYSGNAFLAEETARADWQALNRDLRDLPRLSGDEVRAEVLAPLLTPSLFGEAEVLLDLNGVKVPAGLLELLGNSGAEVVVLDPGATAARIKVYEKYGQHTAAPAPIKAGDVSGWVTQRARQQGVKLDRGAATYLAEAFGDDLASIASELSKLSIIGGGEVLDREQVERVVGREPPGDSFAMLGAATAGRPAEAAAQLGRLLRGGEDPFRLLGAVVWQYSTVTRCVALLAQEGGRVSDAVAAQKLGLKPYPAKKALEVARRLNERRIRAHLGRILDADQAMKSGQEPVVVMERLMVELSL